MFVDPLNVKVNQENYHGHPPPWICDIEMVTHLARKIFWDTIMHEPHDSIRQITPILLISWCHKLNTYFHDFH